MALKGCNSLLKIDGNTVSSLTNISNSITGESLDTTVFDASCTKTFIQGLVSGLIDVTGFYDPNDTNGQSALATAILNGNNVTAPQYLVDGTNGFGAAEAVVTGYNVDSIVGGLVNFSATLQLSGALSVI